MGLGEGLAVGDVPAEAVQTPSWAYDEADEGTDGQRHSARRAVGGRRSPSSVSLLPC